MDDDLKRDPRLEALEAAQAGGERLDNGHSAGNGPGSHDVPGTGSHVSGNGGPVETVVETRTVVVEPAETVVVEERVEPAGGTAPGIRGESWAIAIVFAIIYGLIGYFVITDGHIISFDGMHRLNEAYMTWWNSPPRLSAIGLAQAPLGAVAYLPFTIIKPLATSLVAMPVLTAIAAGMLMALLNSILRRCEVMVGFRYLIILVFGLNPMFVFYAGNGEPVVLGMTMAAMALLSVISWYVTDETRGLVGAGMAMSIACMIDYSYGIWAIGLALAVLIIASGKDGGEERMRSSLIVFITPVIYAGLVWCLLNWVILGNPFEWVTTNPQMISVNSTDTFRNVTATPLDALGDLGKVILGIAPLGFVAILALMFSGSRLAWGLVLVALFAIAAPLGRVLISDQADLMTLAIGLPLAVLALAAMAAVHQAREGWRIPVAVITLIGLVAAVPLGWNAMQDYDYQDQAQAFTRYVDTRDSQEGTRSLGGYAVGIDPERTMAGYINTKLPQNKDSILVDENLSYGVMILSGRPRLFADRADEGVGTWEGLRDDPYGKVDYMLVAIGRSADALAKRYPKMLSGGESGLTPIFRTERYVLVKVAAEAPVISTTPGGTSTAPRPVQPTTPPSADSGNGSSSTFDATTNGSDTTSSSGTSGSGNSSSSGPGSSGQTTAPSVEGE